MKTLWPDEFQKLNYQALSTEPIREGIELTRAYSILRARVVLGSCDPGELKTQATLAGLPDPISALLEAQQAAYSFRDLDQHLARLVETQPVYSTLPGGQVLAAESFFTLGFLSAQASRVQQAVAFQRKALEHYRGAGLSGQAGITLYNLAVNFRHLSMDAEAEAALRELKAAFDESGIPAIGIAYHRFKGYDALHAERLDEAESHFADAIRLAGETGRKQDAAYLAVHRLHCLLALGRLDVALEALAEARKIAPAAGIGPALDGFKFLLDRGILSADECGEFLGKIEASGTDPVARVLLMDGALRRLVRAEEWEALIRIARKAQNDSTRLEQSPGLVDFRRYQIEGLLALGRKQEAEKIARAYEASARAKSHAEKLRWLEGAIAGDREDSAAAPTEIVLDRSQALILVRSLERGETRISAARNPTLSRLINVLAHHPGEGVKSSDLFSKVFEMPFHPHLHEPRLASLLHRSRKALGSESAILRTDGKILLHPSTSVRMQGSTRLRARDSRRNIVLQALRQIRKPRIGLADLEAETRIPRRTLQEDLRWLAQSGQVLRKGDRKGATYRISSEKEIRV